MNSAKKFIKRVKKKKLEVFLKLLHSKFLPHWIVFLLDLGIVFISFFLLLYSISSFGNNFIIHESNFYKGIFLIAICYSLGFIAFKTYSGIIRYSTYIDAIKIFFATSFATALLMGINLVSFELLNNKIYLFHGIFLLCILSFSGLFLLRLLAKETYDRFTQTDSKNYTPILVYGVSQQGIAIAKSLLSEQPVRYKPIGFVGNHSGRFKKRILDLPVYPVGKDLSLLMSDLNCSHLLILKDQIKKEKLSKLLSYCLENNLKVLAAPSLESIDDITKTSKKIRYFKIEDLLQRKPIVLDTKGILNQISNNVVMITGAAGSIGSEICRQLCKFNPKRIVLLDQSESGLFELEQELSRNKIFTHIIPVVGSVTDKSFLEKVYEKFSPRVVYHAAAYKHVPLMEENPYQAIKINIEGTKNVADLAVLYGVEKFVMISTDKAVNPTNVMGATKRAAELYVKALNSDQSVQTKFITTRFGNVLGSNGSVVPLFTKQIHEGGPITITHPDIVRYFMTIPEACQLVLEAGCMGNGGEIFLFDMGEPVKIVDLAKNMIKLAGLTPEKDIKIIFTGLRPGEKLCEELLTDHSTSLPTHHEKIMILSEKKMKASDVLDKINRIIQSSKSFNPTEMVKQLKLLIPEYISKNSPYEEIDFVDEIITSRVSQDY